MVIGRAAGARQIIHPIDSDGRSAVRTSTALAAVLALTAGSHAQDAPSGGTPFGVDGSAGTNLRATPFAAFDQPWAMTFLPDGRLLVTEKGGTLVLVSAEGARVGTVDGVPQVQAAGQGGLGDVVLHPDFEQNSIVYLSYVEREGGESGAVVDRFTIELSDRGGNLSGQERVWTQEPKVSGNGHYSHRIAFGPDGMMYVTSGDRQKLTPAQQNDVNLGKIVRLNDDGSVPDGNPFADVGGVAEQFWTTGHRNPLGIDFDGEGRLWAHEMGPRGGDELNLIESGSNYGWPLVSNGRHYSGAPIPDHGTDPSFNAPETSWVPSISPSGFVIYDGDMFADWQGDGVIGGLSSQAVIRVDIDGDAAREAERYSWDTRIREVEQGPDGAIWVLEDGEGGRLVKLEPATAS